MDEMRNSVIRIIFALLYVVYYARRSSSPCHQLPAEPVRHRDSFLIEHGTGFQAVRQPVRRGAHRFHAILLTNRTTSDVLAAIERSLYLCPPSCTLRLAFQEWRWTPSWTSPSSPHCPGRRRPHGTLGVRLEPRTTHVRTDIWIIERPQPLCRVASGG